MFRCSLVLPHFFVSFHIFDRAFSNKTFWKLDISNSQTSTEHKNVIVSTFHHGCCKLGCGLLIIIIYNNKFAFLVLKLVDKKSHYKMTQKLTDIFNRNNSIAARIHYDQLTRESDIFHFQTEIDLNEKTI